jgi:rhomboid protease GluP
MNDEPLIPVVKETYLSRRPAPDSAKVAAASLAVLVAISAVYWLDPLGLAARLPASREAVLERGEYWRLLTAIGAHADLRHLLANGFVFGVLSYLLYGYYGLRVHPLLTLALGAATTAFATATYPPRTQLLGASGLVYAMAGFWLVLYLLLERRLSFAKRLVRSTGFALVVLAPTAFEPLVSYRAHAIGFGLGVLSGAGYFLERKQVFREAERIEWE